jgi:hypothetical protein
VFHLLTFAKRDFLPSNYHQTLFGDQAEIFAGSRLFYKNRQIRANCSLNRSLDWDLTITVRGDGHLQAGVLARRVQNEKFSQ